MRGRFIVLEGGDGSGKTTLAAALAAGLSAAGHPVFATREPGGTAAGQAIRALLLDPDGPGLDPRTELLLVMAARVEHVVQRIGPALAAGTLVLCDRFLGSTLAYQGARGLDAALMRDLHQRLLGDLAPDLTLLLDLAPDQALARARARGADTIFERRGLAFHTRVRSHFLDLARRDGWVVLDAAASPAALLQAAREAIEPLLAAPPPAA